MIVKENAGINIPIVINMAPMNPLPTYPTKVEKITNGAGITDPNAKPSRNV
jgi:hypothetical protein